MAELSARARLVLYHAIMEYVATGEPVGSRTISKKGGINLSPASIRNVLADLEELEYLYQPHTSAGRVPTDKAFRLFIDVMMEVQELSPQHLELIRARFQSLEPGANVLRETGRLLSQLTGTAAVVVASRSDNLTLKQLRFIVTQPGEVLAVLVLSNGTVQNRFFRSGLAEHDLTSIHNLLDDVIEGRTLGELRDLFARRLATDRVQADDLRRRAFQLGEAAVAGAASMDEAEVVIEGQARLLDQPEFTNVEDVRSVVSALDARENLLHLLEATMEAKGVSVVVGKEAGELGRGQLAIVGTSYVDDGRTVGRIGVIGPTRMDYPKVVPLVTATASAMSEFMQRSRSKNTRGNRDDDE